MPSADRTIVYPLETGAENFAGPAGPMPEPPASRTGFIPIPRSSRASRSASSPARAGSMSASRPRSAIPATSSAAGSAPGRWPRSVTLRARSMSSSIVAPTAVHSSARPPAARPKSSSAPITNGPMISAANCSVCRSAPAIADKAACRPIFARRSTNCSVFRWRAATASCSPAFRRKPNRSSSISARQCSAISPCHASLLHIFLVTFGLFRLDQRSAIEMDTTGCHAVLVSRRGEQQGE